MSGAKQGARVKRVTEGWDEVVVVAAEKECRGRNHKSHRQDAADKKRQKNPGAEVEGA